MPTSRAWKHWVKYEIEGNILCKTEKENELGVTINANITVSEQCRIAPSQDNQIVGMIQEKYYIKGLIAPLYNAIVRPQLQYCIQAWRPYLRKDLNIFEK